MTETLLTYTTLFRSKAGIRCHVEREHVTTLHRKFVDQPPGKRCTAFAITADTRNDFDDIFVTNDFDVALAVEHRLENRCAVARENRSEEHTSELQSLMRLSYDVFCLQTKITLT